MDGWKEEAERIRRMPLAEKVAESIDVIKQVMTLKDADLPIIVNFSGGKDSLTIVTLVKKVTNNVECCYVNGGFDLPQTPEYVKQKCDELNLKLHLAVCGVDKVSHIPGGALENCQTIFDYIEHYGYFPTCGRRWCSTWCKHRVMRAYWNKAYPGRVLYKMNGVRMFESTTRLWKYGDPKHANRWRIDGKWWLRRDHESKNHFCVYPILHWTTEEVKQFLKDEGVVLHEGYKLFGVSGCKWCPVHDVETFRKILEWNPNIYDDFIEVEAKINKPAVIKGNLWLRDIKAEILAKKAQEQSAQSHNEKA